MPSETPNPAAAIQDRYPDEFSHCYGCGRHNEHGLRIRSFWDGKTAVCEFEPRPYHLAMAGYVYGGLIASIIDCHSIGAAAAALAERDGTDDDAQLPRCVTGSLHVDFLRPTPEGVPLVVRAEVLSIDGRKVRVRAELEAAGKVRAEGEVLAIRLSTDDGERS